MKISPHQIIVFAAVARERSFSRAASFLSLGQSAVTQHVSALEREIGAKLFVRSRAGAELTAVGRELFPLADRLRVLDEQFRERANQFADLTIGTLCVCVSTPRPAMALISAFQQQHPGVKVDLTVAPWKDALASVRRREVDVAVVIEPESTDELYCVEIEKQRFVAVLPRRHSLARLKTLAAARLQRETLIMLGASSFTRYWVERKFAELGILPNKTVTTTSYDMMFEAVIHELGVSIALGGAMSRHDGVTMVPINEFTEEHTFCVVCAEDKAPLRTVRSFLDVAVKGIRSEKHWGYPGL